MILISRLFRKFNSVQLRLHRFLKTTNDSAKVHIKYATLIGREHKLPISGVYYSFKGIPYAKSPVNELRFMPPQAIESLQRDELDCSVERGFCLQSDAFTKEIVGEESCLHLNVYTPSISSDSRKCPVLLFLHGGGFISGSGNSELYSPEYLVQEGVVVVTINYRLGPFGFMYLPEGGIEGNFGLKDQLMAMKWVQKHIGEFNGDPENVTLIGHSSASVCGHYHLMNKESKKYFHKAILMSATISMAFTVQTDLQTDLENRARNLAKFLGCKAEKDIDIADFLRNFNALELFLATQKLVNKSELLFRLPFIYQPVVEKPSSTSILIQNPLDCLKTPNLHDKPVMFGVTNADSGWLVPTLYKSLPEYDSNRITFVPHFVRVGNDQRSALSAEIRRLYFKDKPINKDNLSQFVEFLTDTVLNVLTQRSAEIHSRFQHSSPLYYYQFSFDGELNLMKKILRLNLPGAIHFDDIYHLFVRDHGKVQVPEDSPSGRMRRKMCRMWTNFAKYGEPTPDSDATLNEKWTPAGHVDRDSTKYELNCFDIDETCKMIKNPNKERIDFWREVMEKTNGGFLN